MGQGVRYWMCASANLLTKGMFPLKLLVILAAQVFVLSSMV